MKIYTKKGDGGDTSLLHSGDKAVSKADAQVEAYGTIDELGAWIGLIADEWNDSAESIFTVALLKDIQSCLFTIGSILAADTTKELPSFVPRLKQNAIEDIERLIDKMEEKLPPLKSFILTGGRADISRIHIARAVCRRAERRCARIQENVREKNIIPYLNRLGDLLFVLARYKAFLLNVQETLWTPNR